MHYTCYCYCQLENKWSARVSPSGTHDIRKPKKKLCVWTWYLTELKLCGVHEKAQAREALCILWVFPSVPPLCIKAAKISCAKAVGDRDMHRRKLLPLERQQIHFRAFTGWLACWCFCNYRYFLSVLAVNVSGLELPANKPGVPGTKYHSALCQNGNSASNPAITGSSASSLSRPLKLPLPRRAVICGYFLQHTLMSWQNFQFIDMYVAFTLIRLRTNDLHFHNGDDFADYFQ